MPKILKEEVDLKKIESAPSPPPQRLSAMPIFFSCSTGPSLTTYNLHRTDLSSHLSTSNCKIHPTTTISAFNCRDYISFVLGYGLTLMNLKNFELRVVACMRSRHITYAVQLNSGKNLLDQKGFDIPYLSPTLTAKSCISFLKSCKTVDQLKQIQAQIFRVGLHYNPNVLDKLIIFCTDPSLGDLMHAEKTVSFSPKPTLLAYNLLIKALTKRGSFEKAVSSFHKLREDGIAPDNFTYPFVFKAFGLSGEFRGGSGVHGQVIKEGLEFDTYVCNSLIDMYAVLGKVEHMRKVFDEMPERDVVSWNVLISGYVRCERFDDAVNIFKRMRLECDLKPDEATVVSSLSACTATKMLELGKEIHRYADENLVRTLIISNALLDMYSKCGQVGTARRIFDEMPVKNVICWTSMITGYINAGKLDDARYLFDRSPVKDVILWTAMMNGYVQFSSFDEAVDLFRSMQKERIRPDKFTIVALLTGCAKSGALEQGKWIHGYLQENTIKVDTVVGTALIDMYAKCGCIDRALEIFYGLRQKDTTSWTTIICGLATNGKTIDALALFSEMTKSGFRPDDITFIGVFNACSHGGLVEEGRKFFKLMTETYNIQPKLEHYGCLVDLLGRGGLLGEAEELIKDLPNGNSEIVVPLYSALLSACRLHGNVKMGERMAEKLEEMESNDSSVHTLLANTYAFVDRWEDVMKVRKKMKDLGVRKVPGCSSIEVDGAIHEFIVRDPSHSAMDEISAMLGRMADLLMGLKLPSTEEEAAFE